MSSQDLSAALPGVDANDARRIDVTVAHGAERLTLSGWRTRP